LNLAKPLLTALSCQTHSFFVYTFPEDDQSELFIKADFFTSITELDARLLYFLNVNLDAIDIQFGAGMFVDLDKAAALRLKKPEDRNSPNYGRLTRGELRKIPSKKDLFQLCVAAAAGLTVSEASVGLNIPIPEFEDVAKFIPSLVIAKNNSAVKAIDAIIKKEIKIASSSKRRGRALAEEDRRRLQESIPPDAHRALRMLCGEEVLDRLTITCDVNTTAGEFACAKLADIKLDVSAALVFPWMPLLIPAHRYL